MLENIILSVSSDDYICMFDLRLQNSKCRSTFAVLQPQVKRIVIWGDGEYNDIFQWNEFIMTIKPGLSFLLITLYTPCMWVLLYKPGRKKICNNSDTSSTHIDLYDIPHVFYMWIIYTHCLRMLTVYYWYIYIYIL